MPGASIQIQPLILQERAEGVFDELRDLFLYFSRDCAVFLQNILKGVSSKQDFHLIDSRRIFNQVRSSVQAKTSDLDSLLVKSF